MAKKMKSMQQKATAMKQKEIDFLAALDEIEREMEQEKTAGGKYLSALQSIEKQLLSEAKQ